MAGPARRARAPREGARRQGDLARADRRSARSALDASGGDLPRGDRERLRRRDPLGSAAPSEAARRNPRRGRDVALLPLAQGGHRARHGAGRRGSASRARDEDPRSHAGPPPEGQALSALRHPDRENTPRSRRHVPLPAVPAPAKRTDPIARSDRPTRADLDAARGKSIPDVVAPRLDVLFIGINPSLWSGATGLHFARPGNRFWRALHEAGFTARLVSPAEERDLLKRKLGITNLVNRATASADELSVDELRRGARRVERTVRRLRPKVVT